MSHGCDGPDPDRHSAAWEIFLHPLLVLLLHPLLVLLLLLPLLLLHHQRMTGRCVTASGASVGALGLSPAGCVASAGASAAQARAPRLGGRRRWVSASEGVPGVVERAVVL